MVSAPLLQVNPIRGALVPTHLPEQGHGILDTLTAIFAGHPLPMAWGSEVLLQRKTKQLVYDWVSTYLLTLVTEPVVPWKTTFTFTAWLLPID